MTENWETPSCDELTEADSRADRRDIPLVNGVVGPSGSSL